MKKQKEDKPLEYFERSHVWIGVCLALSCYSGFYLYKFIIEVNPIAFIMGTPTVLIIFHSLWMLLNPYAIIYKDKFEIKKSGISNKMWHFIDIKKVSEISGNRFVITYNDDDQERIYIMGIRPSHKQKFRDAVNHHVCKSFVERED